ncbi:hypothetical protein AgCh_007902 [Apium graveolens]
MVNIWFVPGFKFDPSDKQLLDCYLKAKVFGKKLPIDCIKEKEIYGPRANPWEIFNDSSIQWITGKHELEKVVYIFASLTKIAANKESSGVQGNEHNVRKAGCGLWHDETGRSPILEGKKLIGHKRMLVFQINDINGLGDGVCLNKVGYWKMHEYFLPGFENYVVCRITFDGSKKTKVIKADSGTRGSGTKSKAEANTKNATSICTTKDDRREAVLIQSSHIFRGSGKEVPPNHDSKIVNSNYTVEGGRDFSSGLSYENQRCYEKNMLASMNSVCCFDSDGQGLNLNKGLPRYDDGIRVEGQQCQGFAGNDDQRLSSEEEAQPVKRTSGDFGNQLGTASSDFNSGPDDDVYLDLADLFDGYDFWSDMDNILQNDVSMDLGNLVDSEKEIEKFLGQVDNNVLEKQQEQQQPMQNMSCMLGKRESFEAPENYSGPNIRTPSSKNATSSCTSKDDRGEAVLIESSHIFRGSGKRVAPNHDSRIVDSNYTVQGGRDCISGLSYENQRCLQGLILNKVLPKYDDGIRFEGHQCQGFADNDDQRLSYEEEAQRVICMSGDSGNQLGTALSNFNSWADDDVYLDLDDLFDGDDFWSDMNNVLQDDVPMDLGNLIDSEKEMEIFLGQVDNNVSEKEQEKQQQPIQNMSCMLGKRESKLEVAGRICTC